MRGRPTTAHSFPAQRSRAEEAGRIPAVDWHSHAPPPIPAAPDLTAQASRAFPSTPASDSGGRSAMVLSVSVQRSRAEDMDRSPAIDQRSYA